MVCMAEFMHQILSLIQHKFLDAFWEEVVMSFHCVCNDYRAEIWSQQTNWCSLLCIGKLILQFCASSSVVLRTTGRLCVSALCFATAPAYIRKSSDQCQELWNRETKQDPPPCKPHTFYHQILLYLNRNCGRTWIQNFSTQSWWFIKTLNVLQSVVGGFFCLFVGFLMGFFVGVFFVLLLLVF